MNNQDLIKRNQYKRLKKLQRTLKKFSDETRWLTNEFWEEFQPLSELAEDNDNYYIEVDLPGIKKENIKIDLKENILRVYGERKESKKQENAKQHYSEVFYGSFTREFVLPAAVKKEGIKAHYENGVLLITVPKSTKIKTQPIKIE